MGTLKSYLLGFALSIALTLTAFVLVMQNLLNGGVLIAAIVGLALIQLWVQLIFFLHLGHEDGPRWNLMVFLCTASIIFILVAGSLWIMNNLDYRHMSPTDVDSYILHNEAIQK